MTKPLLPTNPEIQAAAKAAGIDVPYYGVEIVGAGSPSPSFRFRLYGGRTVTVRALPGFGATVPTPVGATVPTPVGATGPGLVQDPDPQRAKPQRPKPTVTITGSLDKMTKAELLALAARLGINPRSKATKAQIIQQIKEAT